MATASAVRPWRADSSAMVSVTKTSGGAATADGDDTFDDDLRFSDTLRLSLSGAISRAAYFFKSPKMFRHSLIHGSRPRLSRHLASRESLRPLGAAATGAGFSS